MSAATVSCHTRSAARQSRRDTQLIGEKGAVVKDLIRDQTDYSATQLESIISAAELYPMKISVKKVYTKWLQVEVWN